MGVTTLDPEDGLLRLTRERRARASHQLGVSLGLAAAVRLEALERKIEERLEVEAIGEEVNHALNLSKLSERIFGAEKGLHALRYELNSEASVLEASDVLSENSLAERLYDQVLQ